jgi:hypothetical protein
VAGCCECGDEPSGSCATELVSCNNRYWSSQNPGDFHEVLLRDPKVGVWCGISAK